MKIRYLYEYPYFLDFKEMRIKKSRRYPTFSKNSHHKYATSVLVIQE